MKKIILLSLAIGLLAAPIANANSTEVYFTDLDTDHPQYNEIQWLARSGIIQGYPDGSFRAEECVNRAEFLKLLYLTTEMDAVQRVENPFPDVNENAWYGNYVLAAYQDGVVSGYGDGTFQPESCVTKPEVLKMASEAYYTDEDINVPLNTDDPMPNGVTQDAWFFKYYNFAMPKNLAVYDEEFTELYPITFQGATRGDVAETLWRFQALQDNNQAVFSSQTSAPQEIFQQYQGVDEMLSFYFPADWEITADYFYETAGGAVSEKATIELMTPIGDEVIINGRMIQCGALEDFEARCYETKLGYLIATFSPSGDIFDGIHKIKETLTYESPEFQDEPLVRYEWEEQGLSLNIPKSYYIQGFSSNSFRLSEEVKPVESDSIVFLTRVSVINQSIEEHLAEVQENTEIEISQDMYGDNFYTTYSYYSEFGGFTQYVHLMELEEGRTVQVFSGPNQGKMSAEILRSLQSN